MTAILALLFWVVFQQQPLATIEGTAVRAGAPEALPNLRIELWPTSSVATTDALGRFQFPGVEPGTYTLFTESNGVRSRTPLKVQSGQRLAPVQLKVNYAPTIYGTIFDHNSERAAAVRVQAFQVRYTPYGQRMRAVASALTNDRGEYRLSRLRPGEYYVSASYSEADQRLDKPEVKLTPNLSKPDEGLPSMFFGGSSSARDATSVKLGPDLDSASVDIFLKDEKHFTVSGQILQGCARLALVPQGGSLNSEKDFTHAACNSFTIKGVSPGVYILVAVGEGVSSEPVQFAVGGQDVRDIRVTMVRAVTVAGQVSLEGTGLFGGGGPGGARGGGGGGGGGRGGRGGLPVDAAWGDTQVTLVRNFRDFEWRVGVKVVSDGSFSIPNVGPGDYDVLVEPLSDRTFLKSVRGGAQDLLVNPLRINSNASPPLSIVLSSNGATLEGIVVDRAGTSASGAEVVMIPTSSGREDLYKVAWANSQGKFHIDTISPGTYTMIAFEDIPPDAQFQIGSDIPAAVRRFGAWMTSIRVGDSSQADLRLTLVPASETDRGLR